MALGDVALPDYEHCELSHSLYVLWFFHVEQQVKKQSDQISGAQKPNRIDTYYPFDLWHSFDISSMPLLTFVKPPVKLCIK